MAEIHLKYRRVGDAYSGELAGTPFEGLSFASIMSMLSRRVQGVPDEELPEVRLERTERAGLMPAFFTPAQVLLLRDDPARLAQELSPPAVTVHVRDAKASEPKGELSVDREPLRAGFDTLADSFGDVVYLSLRDGRVESPYTGRWVPLEEVPGAVPVHPEWASIDTEKLLASGHPQFFLPRRWTRLTWVSQGKLRGLYEAFKKEKNDVDGR